MHYCMYCNSSKHSNNIKIKNKEIIFLIVLFATLLLISLQIFRLFPDFLRIFDLVVAISFLVILIFVSTSQWLSTKAFWALEI